MPRPSHFDGRDNTTKLLVHWVICNNLFTVTNKYPITMAKKDFEVSYTQLKRVISGTKLKGGLEYKRIEKLAEEADDQPPSN